MLVLHGPNETLLQEVFSNRIVVDATTEKTAERRFMIQQASKQIILIWNR